MRIAVANHHGHRVGGIETYLATVIPPLVGSGAEIGCLFETIDPHAESILCRDAPVTSWTCGSDPRAALDALGRWRPDVVFVHGLASATLEHQLLTVAPAVLFAHSYYGTCISGSKTYATPVAEVCTRRFGWPCLAAFYPRRCGGLSPITMARQYATQAARLRLLERYRAVLVASRHMKAEYARHGIDDKVRVVGLPVVDQAAENDAAVAGPEWRLLYLGRLEWTKGPDLALKAAALAASETGRSVVLTIAGEGRMLDALQTRARVLTQRVPGLRVDFRGWLDAPERDITLRRTDLLVVPSRWPEPFGLVGIEAARHGVPSAAFAAGGIPEWLDNEVSGACVPGRPDARRLAAGIVECLRDPVRLAEMRLAARRSARRFLLADHVAAVTSALRDAVNGAA